MIPIAAWVRHIASAVLTAGISTANAGPVTQFANPLDVKIADPAILDTKEGLFRYYLAGTSTARYASNDLVNWRRLSDWVKLDGTWVREVPWAAESLEYNGKFYYHFSAPGKTSDGRRCICIAVADSPDDVFRPLAFPLWQDKFGWIDSSIFIDDDRTPYLFVTNDLKNAFDGKARICVAKLSKDFTRLESEPQFLIEPSQPWEHAWQEGAAVLRHNGIYYMTWSSNLFASDRYSVGYATAPSPLGPFTKAAENPILAMGSCAPALIGHAGPGHNSFVRSPDGSELFAVYHTRRNSPEGGERQLNIDRAQFLPVEDGPDRLVFPGAPSLIMQPYPAGSPPSPRATSDEFDGPSLDLDRWQVFGPVPRMIAIEEGQLRIRLRPGQVWQTLPGGENILLQYAPEGDWSITTRVDFDPQRDFEQAFLVVWQDTNNYVMLKNIHSGTQKFEASIELGEKFTSWFIPNDIGTSSWMRISSRNGCLYRQEVSADGRTWHQAGPDTIAVLQDIKVGLGASRPESDRTNATAGFDFFRVTF